MVFDRAAATGDRARPLIIGHRGAAGLRPENTLPGFAYAIELGVAAVELDVHLVEGNLVVIHDDTLERTTNGTGRVSDCSLAELRQLDAGAGARVPLLEEVLELLPASIGINVDLKGHNTAPELCRFLQARPGRDVLVSSFDHDALRAFHQVSRDVSVAPLFHRWRRNGWQIAAEFQAWSINLSVRIATPARIAQAHARGYRVLVYTVNELEVAKGLIASGVDGVFTDHPELITPDAPGD